MCSTATFDCLSSKVEQKRLFSKETSTDSADPQMFVLLILDAFSNDSETFPVTRSITIISIEFIATLWTRIPLLDSFAYHFHLSMLE
jgi:hypothetical protein